MTITRPAFRSFCLPEPIGATGLVLVYEGGYVVLPGRLYSELAQLIDGERTTGDIVGLLQGRVSEPEVYYGLSQLEKRGLIVEAGAEVPVNVAAFWEMLKLDAAESARRLAASSVTLTALDDAAVPAFTAALESLGVGLAETRGFPVVLTDDYLRPALVGLNAEMLKAGRPWMLAKAVGTVLWLGPIFRPGQTGCWECMAQRLRTNRSVESFLREKAVTDEPVVTSRAWLPTSLRVGADLAATEAAKWLAGEADHRLVGAVITVNALTLESQRHVLVRRPQCPVCGNPEEYSRPKKIVLESRPKRFTADGGHRTMLPEQTVHRVEHHISPITGAITSLWRGDNGENPVMHAYVAGHNFAHTYGDIASLSRSLRTLAGGKGASDIQAKASALAEAIERYSAVYRGDEPKIRASYRSLGAEAIDPRHLLLFSEEQYRNRAATRDAPTLFHLVPEPFREDAEIDWTPVWSLTNETFKYVPTAYCYYNYGRAAGLRADEVICLADSNGTAAGNTIEEAILQGFMEVAERDCVGIFWYNRIRRPAVDLASFDDPYFRLLGQYLEASKRKLHVLDITDDLGIPAFCGVTWRADRAPGQPQEIIVGFGAHFDARLALMRALTECNQFLASFERFGDSDDRYMGYEPLAVQWWQMATLENQPYLQPDESLPLRRASDYPKLWSDDLRTDVEACVRIAKEHGLETLVLDHSRPDLDLNVARVIVPGGRHFWKRFAPGRLYDVPVELGWLKAPLKEEDLNPFPVFF